MHFVKFKMVQTDISTNTTEACKNSNFISSEESDSCMVVNQSIALHVFPTRMLTSLSVDEIWLPRYMNWFTNFRGLPVNEEIMPS